MTGGLSIFVREMHELINRPFFALCIMLVPVGFLYIAGNSNVHNILVKVMLHPADNAQPNHEKVHELLEEFTDIRVVNRSWHPWATAEEMSLHKAEIALVWDNEGWHFFLRPGVNGRDRLRALAFQMAISIGVEKPWQIKILEANLDESGANDGFDLGMLSRFRMTPLGPPEDRLFADLIPRVIALVVVFMPFLFACQTIVREKENGMLAALLVAPNVGWWSIVSGKILATVFISTVNLLVLLLAAIAMFDVPIRSGVWPVLGVQLLAIFVSTLFGLATSTLVGTHRQAYFLSAIYAFCLIFLTGLIFPLERAIDTVNSMSHLLPLTFSLAPLTEWMTNGIYGWPFVMEQQWLGLQLIAGLGLLFISVEIARRRL